MLWSSETDESFPDKRWKTEDHFELIRETFERTTEATSVSGLVWHTADCCWWGDWRMEIMSLGSCPYKWVAFWTFIVISDIASRLLTFYTKQLNISWQLWHIMFHVKISGNAPFFLCCCSYLFTFLLSSQFYWHIRLKSTAYFFWPAPPPCIFKHYFCAFASNYW